jgi:hypothetical protein
MSRIWILDRPEIYENQILIQEATKKQKRIFELIWSSNTREMARE